MPRSYAGFAYLLSIPLLLSAVRCALWAAHCITVINYLSVAGQARWLIV